MTNARFLNQSKREQGEGEGGMEWKWRLVGDGYLVTKYYAPEHSVILAFFGVI